MNQIEKGHSPFAQELGQGEDSAQLLIATIS